MDKLGIAPPQYNTEIGQMRLALGDTDYIPAGSGGDPDLGFYQYFSDVELQAYLDMYGDFAEAVMMAALSQVALNQNKEIRTDDLHVKDGAQSRWIAIYNLWRDRVEDSAAYVDIVYREDSHRRWPEAAPMPYPWSCI